MKTLLALVNNPVDSGGFVRYAAEMASDMGHDLHFLYVLNPATYTLTTGTAAATSHPAGTEIDVIRMQQEKDHALRLIEGQLKKVPAEVTSSLKTSISGETGTLDMVVNTYIEENKGDLLIAENQHEEGFWISDTNTELILNISCPGWLIPRDARYRHHKKIIYATDFNQKDQEGIKNLKELTGRHFPEIIALHVSDPDDSEQQEKLEKFRENLAREAGSEKLRVKSLIEENGKGLAERLNDYATNMDADLIVLLKANRSFFERIFKSSDTKQMIKKARLPLLIFHEKEFE